MDSLKEIKLGIKCKFGDTDCEFTYKRNFNGYNYDKRFTDSDSCYIRKDEILSIIENKEKVCSDFSFYIKETHRINIYREESKEVEKEVEVLNKPLQSIIKFRNKLDIIIKEKGILFLYSGFINTINDGFKKEYSISDSNYINMFCKLIEKLQTKVSELKKTVQETIEKNENEFVTLKNRFDSNKYRIEILKNDLTKISTSISSKKKEIEAKDLEIERLKKQLLKEDEFKSLSLPYNKSKKKLEKEIKSLEKQIISLTDKISKLKENSDYLETTSINLKPKNKKLMKNAEIFFQEQETNLTESLRSFKFYKNIMILKERRSNSEDNESINDLILNYKKTLDEMIKRFKLIEEQDFVMAFPNPKSLINLLLKYNIVGYFNSNLMELTKNNDVLNYENEIISLFLQVINRIKTRSYIIKKHKIFFPFSSGLLCKISTYNVSISLYDNPEIYLITEGNIVKSYHDSIHISSIIGLLILYKKVLLKIKLSPSTTLLGFNSNFIAKDIERLQEIEDRQKAEDEYWEEFWDDDDDY